MEPKWKRLFVVGAGSIAMAWLGCGGSVSTPPPSGTGSSGAGGDAQGGAGGEGGGAAQGGGGINTGAGGGGNGAGGAGGGEACAPGAIEACYSGPAGSEGVGVCHAGTRQCSLDGAGFGPCLNEVTPGPEDCATNADEDCDGSLGGPSTPLVLVSPSSGASAAGSDITLTWSGGAPPYQVELAFDSAFTDLVTAPIATVDTNVTVPNINGGRFYWRVTSGGICAPAPTPAAELRVTCNPINLTGSPAEAETQPQVIWNENDKEYGVVFMKGAPSKLYFARVSRLGAILSGPTEITGASMPPISGGYQSPTLAYVASNDTWAVVYHREGVDQAYVTLFDDSAAALATRELSDGSDSECQSVDYHPAVDMIVTSNDVGGSVWNTNVHGFNNALDAPPQMLLNATQGAAFPYNGAFGSIVAMPGLVGSPPSAMIAFHYRASTSPPLFHGMIQSVDLAGESIQWPKGAANIAGKTFAPDVKYSPAPKMAWSPEAQVLGLAYIRDDDGVWETKNDAFFVTINPSSGTLLMPPVHLNAAAPAKVHPLAVQIAWDGEEFLVSWNDARDPLADRRMRVTKFSGAGAQIGAGDFLYPHAGNVSAPTNVGRGIAGHDRIHTVAYMHKSAPADNMDVWLCIEPEYQ